MKHIRNHRDKLCSSNGSVNTLLVMKANIITPLVHKWGNQGPKTTWQLFIISTHTFLTFLPGTAKTSEPAEYHIAIRWTRGNRHMPDNNLPHLQSGSPVYGQPEEIYPRAQCELSAHPPVLPQILLWNVSGKVLGGVGRWGGPGCSGIPRLLWMTFWNLWSRKGMGGSCCGRCWRGKGGIFCPGFH